MKIRRWFVLAIALVFAGLAVSGCNTVRGVGKDIQEGGRAVEDVAR